MAASPFIDLTVGEFLWGYQDSLSDIINNVLRFKYKLSVPMFGIFAMKNRTQEDMVTIFTGEEDTMMTGVITQYGEKTSLDYWSTRECNRIDGTDGTIYPLSAIKPNATLYLYVKEMCRRMPFVYDTSKVDDHGITVYRYNLAKDVFESGKVNPGNRCFCNHRIREVECMPSGVFNASPCAFGGPIITSLPHFMHGDPILLQDFEGLSPHPELHESFVEIDPKLGLPMSGKSRFQLNVMVRKAAVLSRKPYRDQMILPVSWMDYGVDRLPDDLSSMIYNLVLFIDMTEVYLSACFVIAIVVFCGLIVRKLVPRRRSGLFNRNLELSTVVMPLVVSPEKV
ncbi:UNVERIFIED_CONTAM: hypothetical protein PYX00_001877 [Menopon gallinae]|uniref:Scavenger receptor class B member 1 n=1 Tax=Menopon gallinae TaxID=328185 RepID=A0AAW2IEF1_9NEOP